MIAKSEDVARLAGVSRGAVSQILNGRGERFSASTIERVKEAALELDYQPSAAGRALAMGSSDFVIALIPNTTFGGNLQDIFGAATEQLAEQGLTLVLRLATTTTAALGRLVTGMAPRAILSLTPFSDEERELLERRGVRAFEPHLASEDQFDREIGRLQARHLIERGSTRLAVARLRDARQDPFGQGREDGVREICRQEGLADPEVVHLGVDLDEALAALDRLSPPEIGIACYNDDIATCLLSAARIRSFVVPGQVALIGMDRTPLSQVTVPRLTTISYDVTAPTKNMIANFLSVLGRTPVPEGPPNALALELEAGGTT
ncbi:LacI family DNA-binding transcriptional regulator [Microbacterium sp. KSW2-21]|uniref:LacI family DNA-binding transcriptional regulator n=1 Tax=Microbacterium algihabitans TaxID=3075992 RepID=A0ABU3S007_9MICO|nr:LacI family DNA-binding transcriptional regulator [Microbacterium sp. KSW2-21]MDU0328443.1 LacI family DNA-binding transcriptional regulator [Microbacterium sp. KSW2-21]